MANLHKVKMITENMVDYIVQNWQQAYDDTYYLFELIRDSGYMPDMIVGIARGGWIPARLLADFFSLKQTANIKVEAYQMVGQLDVEAKITQDINAPLADKNILIVDDIADTGSSLEVVLDSLENRNFEDLKIATLYYKSHSKIAPDYFVENVKDWVIFPWEIYETIRDFEDKWSDLNQDEILKKCKDIGLPAGMVNSYFSE